MSSIPLLIVILGPTATGKTRFAAQLAHRFNGEIISADSRQVYKSMNLGTGKDYEDYIVENENIPYHLIDIAEPGTDYHVYRFQRDFSAAFIDITGRHKIPFLCGGTGMYLEAVLSGYQLLEVPENLRLRSELQHLEIFELQNLIQKYPLHNTTDLLERDRLIRALEIYSYHENHPEKRFELPGFLPVVFGISLPREEIRERITWRLEQRLASGMIEEVKGLLHNGVPVEKMEYYGLEYKFIAQYLSGKLSKESMFRLLNTAIHQFAKRQMTWFRRMEKRGTVITWINGHLQPEEKIAIVEKKIREIYNHAGKHDK